MNVEAESSPLAHTIQSAARKATIGRTTLYNAIRSGELRARKIGRRTVILEHDLARWLSTLPTAA